MKIIELIAITLTLILFSECKTEYKVIKQEIGSSYVKLNIEYSGSEDYYIKIKNKIVKNLILNFKSLTYTDFNIEIKDANKVRFQVPQGGLFPTDPNSNFTFPINLANYIFTYQSNPFTFKVIRKTDLSILFDSSADDFIYSQYYIQIATYSDTQFLYGLSQRFTDTFRVQTGKWTIFNRDRGQKMDTGTGLQTHGYYPIYLARQKKLKFHMSYFRNSNAMDVIVDNVKTDQYKVTYKVIGGIIDLRFFLGQKNPQLMVQKFHQYLGTSAIPPFWSLGFHQCRWGYQNVTDLEKVITNYQTNGIPLDTIWSDIDYMKDYQTFTIDQKRYPADKMAQIISKYRFVPIVQPSIRFGMGKAYQEGLKRNIFIKDADGSFQKGKVWAGSVLFPDYFHPNSTQYWNTMLQTLYSQVQFSGIWLDMNQISNLCNGPCQTPKQQGFDYSNDIPYHPGNDLIQTQAIPLNSTHYEGRLQADVHAFFGLMETKVTYDYLKNKGRPFIITRSTTLGSNRYGFHWTGDNYANQQFLKTSISSNFMFNFWGIQMVGSDICGFGGNATEENCARWFQLGSLYPFARNHNDIQAIDQQPYALGPKVLESSLKNIKFRYSILKAYYREFIIKKGKGSIFKPLMFQFYEDQNCFSDEIADTQFLIGRSLMSAPVVQSGQSREVYFPMVNWYSLETGKFYPSYSLFIITNSITDLVPVYLRQGDLIFRQEVTNVTKTHHLNNHFYMVGGFSYIKQRSTSVIDQYQSNGGVLSIQNYNNQTLIDECLRSGCDYLMKATLQIEKLSQKRNIIFEWQFTGNQMTKQLIIIDRVVIYTKQFNIKAVFTQPIEIYGIGKQTRDISSEVIQIAYS